MFPYTYILFPYLKYYYIFLNFSRKIKIESAAYIKSLICYRKKKLAEHKLCVYICREKKNAMKK